jgi:hypothetical protein
MKVFSLSQIVYYGSRNRAKLKRKAIRPARLAPWLHFYRNGDDGSFVNLLGIDHGTFEILHNVVFEEDSQMENAAENLNWIHVEIWAYILWLWAAERRMLN